MSSSYSCATSDANYCTSYSSGYYFTYDGFYGSAVDPYSD